MPESVTRSKLRAVPCTMQRAKAIVDEIHRHHGSSTSALFAIAVADEDNCVRGVALIGRLVARVLDDGFTLEVTRVATDGAANACSALYGAARRAAVALGYARVITYTRADEPGSSPRGAGFTDDGEIRARSWNMPGRPRTDKTEVVQRRRWVMDLAAGADELTWPTLGNPDQLAITDEIAEIDPRITAEVARLADAAGPLSLAS